MHEKKLYSYAVIRLVPRVEREEFLNVGVLLFCKDAAFLDARTYLDQERVVCFHPQLKEQLSEISLYLESIHRICEGHPSAGKLGTMTLSERFRFLTAHRSTLIQTSPAHPGFCNHPEQKLQALIEELVLITR
jgi:hypothetical protein